MNKIERLESAIALEEFRPLRAAVITGCSVGNEMWDEPSFNVCRNVAVLEGTSGDLFAAGRPICVSHALLIAAEKQTMAHNSTCARPTTPGRCCTEYVTADKPCKEHGPLETLVANI